MATTFDVISDDFLSDLQAISDLVVLVESGGGSSKSRVASINSATLLLAATFEEFVREMGRQYAREVVERTTDSKYLPRKLAAAAWKRTLEELARAKIDTGGTTSPLVHIATEARATFDSLCRFLEGDITQNIYKSLVHNETNMRPEQINAIFRICDLSDLCLKLSAYIPLKEHFDEHDVNRVHGKLLVSINDFMETRNQITHALNPRNSVSPTQFIQNIIFFKSVSLAMAACLAEN